MTNKIRIALVLAFLAADSSNALFAREAARQYNVDYLNEEVLSPDESRLADYLKERAAISQSILASKSPYQLRQKLKILNKKIAYLENEITRNRQRGLRIENPPSVTPVPSPPKPKKEEPIILVRPPTPPPILVAPAKMPPPPVLPAETPALVAETKVQKSTAKMGADWVAMSPEEKEMYVFSATGALVRHDVVLMESSYVYIQVLNETLEKNPSLKDQYLDDLLISSIYEHERHTRTAIDKIKIRR